MNYILAHGYNQGKERADLVGRFEPVHGLTLDSPLAAGERCRGAAPWDPGPQGSGDEGLHAGMEGHRGVVRGGAPACRSLPRKGVAMCDEGRRPAWEDWRGIAEAGDREERPRLILKANLGRARQKAGLVCWAGSMYKDGSRASLQRIFYNAYMRLSCEFCNIHSKRCTICVAL